jgi:hypothetical protein
MTAIGGKLELAVKLPARPALQLQYLRDGNGMRVAPEASSIVLSARESQPRPSSISLDLGQLPRRGVQATSDQRLITSCCASPSRLCMRVKSFATKRIGSIACTGTGCGP